VVEIDGPAHGRPHTQLDDAGRDLTLRAAGYTVLRFTDADVHLRRREILSAVAGVVGR
jgi:very-short-patch-repair endonuclease